MKKLLFILSVLLFSFNNSDGQWFVKKYQISVINQISRSQFEKSLEKAKYNLLTPSIIAGSGGCICTINVFSA
jgi:hypothetical protein